MMFQMLGVMAEFEQKSIVSRTKIGMLKKAKSGAWPGGRVPLGYLFNAETGLEIQDDEALIIKKIFAKYTERKDGSSTIARSLNDAGYRTKRGKKFNRKSILHILRNPFYVGQFRWQKTEFKSDHKPIISLATFDEAKLILEKRSAESPGHKWHNQDQRLLSGLIYCKKCRSRMVAVSANAKGTKYSYYTCRRRFDTADCDQDSIRADLVEKQILSEIQTVFRDKALLDSIWKSAQQKLAANAPAIETELKNLDKQRTKHQAALDKYFQAFETGSMTPATCNHRVEELSTQIKQLDEERVVLQQKRHSLDLPAIKNDFLQEILVNLKGVVDAVPTPQKSTFSTYS